MAENGNSPENKGLEQAKTGAYKPAYKEKPKTTENDPTPLPPDLAEIVERWPKLPEHIKEAIKALVQTCIDGGK